MQRVFGREDRICSSSGAAVAIIDGLCKKPTKTQCKIDGNETTEFFILFVGTQNSNVALIGTDNRLAWTSWRNIIIFIFLKTCLHVAYRAFPVSTVFEQFRTVWAHDCMSFVLIN